MRISTRNARKIRAGINRARHDFVHYKGFASIVGDFSQENLEERAYWRTIYRFHPHLQPKPVKLPPVPGINATPPQPPKGPSRLSRKP